MSSDRRTRKRLATRQAISDAATLLFIERGFDHVTVNEIAAAADVGRMTVFNHFPRKEDMFFDRDEEGREILRNALRQRDPGVAPIEALRLLAHRLVAERNPAVEFSARSQSFIETVRGERNPQGPGAGNFVTNSRNHDAGARRERRAGTDRSRCLSRGPTSSWRRGPSLSSRLTAPFGRRGMQRKRKPPFLAIVDKGFHRPESRYGRNPLRLNNPLPFFEIHYEQTPCRYLRHGRASTPQASASSFRFSRDFLRM